MRDAFEGWCAALALFILTCVLAVWVAVAGAESRGLAIDMPYVGPDERLFISDCSVTAVNSLARIKDKAQAELDRCSVPTITTTTTVPTTTLPPLGYLTKFEGLMNDHGSRHCNALDPAMSVWDAEQSIAYYDGIWVYKQIAEYTGDSGWENCAAYVRDFYLQRFDSLGPSSTGLKKLARWVFPHGLKVDGQTSYLNDLALNSSYAAFGSPVLGADSSLSDTHSLTRALAYLLQTYIHTQLPERQAALTATKDYAKNLS